MATYNFTPKIREEYLQTLSQNPLRWAGDSIDEIDKAIAKGSHAFDPVTEQDPDDWVLSNKVFLENQVDIFKELNLEVPDIILATIIKASQFLAAG
jgi:hypothetical protein